ncbi:MULTISPECIES: DUF4124 domain-containing protein [unclassified Duganella]|uniref:DUF4124 domain-containing protein n=1 Tax=unclassified Duganella TaxID=2636909 RepID=UPI000E356F79|nr:MULTISPECIES: DUF4124 domain-containing protein [unclassified Duganella]RFP13691.1 DUF4124 domain-containing protein [Duganella sp. BJB475]RFP36399.1 DUF4124 domain-containing protein [Duganella sp. BJB476]
MKISAVLLWAVALAAHGQGVNKCTVDGKVSYSDLPCPANAASATTLAVPIAPAADPAAAADLARQRKEAAKLEKARHQHEDQDARAADKAAQAAVAQRKRCGKLKLNKRWADEDVVRASLPNLDNAKLRAKRAGDTLALECPK